MLRPVSAALIQRTAPSPRVRRRAGRLADATEASVHLAEDEAIEESVSPARETRFVPGERASTQAPFRKVAPGVLAALLKLRLGG